MSMIGCTKMIITLDHFTLPAVDVRCRLDHPTEGGLGAWPQLSEAFPVVPGADQEEGLPRSSRSLQWLQLRAGNVQEPGSLRRRATDSQVAKQRRSEWQIQVLPPLKIRQAFQLCLLQKYGWFIHLDLPFLTSQQAINHDGSTSSSLAGY